MKIESLIRTVIQIALPFDNLTTLRVSPKTLRVIEMSKAASTFSPALRKTIRQVECLRRGRRKPASRQCKHSASLAFALPLRSRYSEFLTLSILRVKNSLPLTVSADTTTPRSLSLETRPLISCLRYAPPNRRPGDCKMTVGGIFVGPSGPRKHHATDLAYRLLRR